MGVTYILVGTPEEIAGLGAKKVDLNGRAVLVTKLDDGYVAFSNICPHQGFELWAQDIEGDKVYCIGHNWEFDIRTGKCEYPTYGPPLATLPVEERDGQVYVRVEW